MPELGEINLGPGAGQPQRGTDLTQMLNQQANKALTDIDREWSEKYQMLNKQYDWSRHEKRPDEITRLRGRLEQDIAQRRQAITTGFGNTISKFKMLDELFVHDPQQAEKLKWETMVGKDVAKAMFPEQRDPQLAHQRNLAEQNRTMDVTKAFVIEGGKLYASKLDDKGYVIGVADKSKPATQDEIKLWAMSKDALSKLEQEELGILGQLSDAGLPDPVYLQSLLTGQRRKGLFSKLAGYLPTGKEMRSMYGFDSKPDGTFAQKVTKTLPKQPQRKSSRQGLLAEYRRLGGSNTPEGKAFADRNLR